MEMRELINKVKIANIILTEDHNSEKTILIRSKIDKSIRFDVTYKNGKIFRVGSSGTFPDLLENRPYFDLFIKIAPGKEMDFDLLRAILSKIPELYVEDIV